MYINEDKIIINDFEKQAIENYCYEKLSKFNNVKRDDFIHEYGDNVGENGVNVYYDGRIDFYWSCNDDITICFHAKLKKDKNGQVDRFNQDFLKYTNDIDFIGGEYQDKFKIQRTEEYKEIKDILDSMYSELYSTPSDISYWFGNKGLK